jgi:hypothetical protein
MKYKIKENYWFAQRRISGLFSIYGLQVIKSMMMGTCPLITQFQPLMMLYDSSKNSTWLQALIGGYTESCSVVGDQISGVNHYILPFLRERRSRFFKFFDFGHDILQIF